MRQRIQAPERGLPAIRSGRDGREKGRFSRPTPALVLGLALGCLAVFLSYQWITGRSITVGRDKLLGRQKAATEAIGKEWQSLASKLEAQTVEASSEGAAEFVDPEFAGTDFRNLPSVYLRLRVQDAASPSSIRKAAEISVQDAFSTCLMRDSALPKQIPSAEKPALDEYGFPKEVEEDPMEKRLWNLKDGYHAARIFTEEYRAELAGITDELRLRVYEAQFQRAEQRELPKTIALLKRARYFVLLLDETPSDFAGDGSAPRVEDLEPIKHPVRVSIFDLKKDKLVLRTRKEVEADFRGLSGSIGIDPRAKIAMQRQGNNCLLANEVVKTAGTKK
jgi:hypothetical protein